MLLLAALQLLVAFGKGLLGIRDIDYALTPEAFASGVFVFLGLSSNGTESGAKLNALSCEGFTASSCT